MEVSQRTSADNKKEVFHLILKGHGGGAQYGDENHRLIIANHQVLVSWDVKKWLETIQVKRKAVTDLVPYCKTSNGFG